MITLEHEERYDREGALYIFHATQSYGGPEYYINGSKVLQSFYGQCKRRTKSSMELNALRYLWIRDKATHDQLDRMIVLESKDVDAWVDERCKPWGE